MSFKTLEQRYNEKVNDLYRDATSKFENGRPSRGANDDPIIVRRIGDGYFGGVSRALGRFLPVTSAFQDVKRLTLFTASIRGATFLAKQALLQTGNTFQTTRLLNPAFAIANAVPFLHVRRHLSGLSLSGLIGKTDTSTGNVRSMGQLQQETYEKALGSGASGLRAFFGPIVSAVGSKKNVGWRSAGTTGYVMSDTWKTSRPELGNGSIDAYIYTKQNKGSYVFKFGGRAGKAVFYIPYGAKYLKLPHDAPSAPGRDYKDGTLTRQLVVNPQNVQGADTARSNLIEKSPSAMSSSYDPSSGQRAIYQARPQDLIATELGISQPLKYIRPSGRLNRKPSTYIEEANERTDLTTAARVNKLFPYDSINDEFKDYITVSFAMGKNEHVKFRAFIKDLQQSASPQYKDYQYIGRTEKFINYSGVQREVSFKLGVLAERKDELNEMWKRINYLTGMVFPYTVTNGIYQPNIVRMTIGKVFVNQPMYITSLSTNFSEIIESWDIDAEIPMGAQIDMKCLLIEKSQKVANSPFYEITKEYFQAELAERRRNQKPPSTAAPDVLSNKG